MASEHTPPSKVQRENIVCEVKAKVEVEGKELFDPKDIEKLLVNDDYVARFWIHSFFIPGDRLENTANLVINTFKWRKQFGVRDITEEDLDKNIKERGSLYSHNRDREGFKILVFCIRKHVKDQQNMQKMKEFFVYTLDRLEREENGGKITIVFDSENAGLSNFDIELVRFIIQVLIGYYPNFVNKILVFEMPWVLNAAWKIIKSLLPAPAVARINFVSKSSIKQIIAPDNLLREWGGLDNWEYVWEPESVRKEVHEDATEDDCARISPNKAVLFSVTEQATLEAEVLIKNISSACLAFKVKSTCPSLFLVRPHTAVISPGQDLLVKIWTPDVNSHHKISSQQFQINYLTLDPHQDQDNLSSLFSNSSQTSSTILGCRLDKSVSHDMTSETPGTVTSIQNKTRVLNDRVYFLEEKLQYLQQMLIFQGVLAIVFIAYRCFWSSSEDFQNEVEL